ncbi:neurogenic locus protein delta-like [Octopus vulgaris]|uniref:Delta-like protein n=1 Tax=Octopus vulgaris TaxID=6645 RepID=A0AA36FBN0_OCTVU|nr:neurogenic locus protein delta-like [Octopus vulgaris]
MSHQLHRIICLTLVVLLLSSEVSGIGVFEVRIVSFYNSDSITQTRTCCEGITENSVCSEKCRTYFSICLMHYQNPPPLDSKCTFGADMTPVLGESTFHLGSHANVIRTIELPFSFAWPQSFTLSVEAWHDNLRNDTFRDPRYMIQRVVHTSIVQPSHRWVKKVMRSNITMMSFEYRVVCNKNYYGKKCDHFCRVRDDELGHYYCTENGTRKCMEGWKGNYCDQAICPDQCHNSYGSCKKPNECSCRIGWEGEFCTKCKKDPNCLHGICYEPWQCICQHGWTGFLCNIDKNYCSKYKPCENGGSCKFDPTSNYTCSCPPSFKGSNCQYKRCPRENPCSNDGKCVEIHTGYRCHCAEGFTGDRCEKHVKSCDKIVCENHGTCVMGEVGGWCACPKGFTGDFCEKEINECQSSPCQNGGTCVEYFDDYACSCPSDYGGKNCELYLPCPCRNGGTCIGLSRCECRNGFTGRRCEILINKCKRLRCRNGGTCLSYAREGREECICPLVIIQMCIICSSYLEL